MKTVYLFQFGKGLIGGALIGQIMRQQKTLEERYGLRLVYAGCCGRAAAVIDPEGFHSMLTERNGDAARLLAEHPERIDHPDAVELAGRLARLNIENLMVVDVTAAALTPVHLACLRNGVPVITANKKPVADDYAAYAEMQQRGRSDEMRYWYETTVGAGLPVISTLRELVVTGDTVLEIAGCLSGTLGYICAQLDTGRRFSEIVEDARARGYTEPDPRDDLNGMDVARKALILAREIGYTLDIGDIRVERMISGTLEQAGTVEAFMAQLHTEDERYARKAAESRSRGEALRYMATVRDGRCDVALRSVPRDSPPGSLSGPDNLILFRTDRYSASPLVIRGPGAGAEVTAAGVFGDIIKAANVFMVRSSSQG